MVAVDANGQPGFPRVRRDDGARHAQVQVLTIGGAGVARIVSFNQPGTVPVFRLPPVLG